MATDPVCGMYVPETSDLYVDRDGTRYYFCSKGCMDKFLEPEKEGKNLARKLVIAWTFSLPVLVLTYIYTGALRDIILLVLSLPVVFYSGTQFYPGAISAIRTRSGNMDLLVSLGILTAFFFSVFVSFFPHAIPHSMVYFDSSDFIVSLILTGSYVESLVKAKASDAGNRLLSLIPETVHLVSDGGIVDIESSKISPENLVEVRPGETVPVDGIVERGSADVDSSMITGESLPITVNPGSKVSSGMKDLNGTIVVRVQAVGPNSTVGKIYSFIKMASSGRTKIQRIADVFSSYFVPVVLAAATASFLFWFFYLRSIGDPYFIETAILSFVSVIVIACPCAIGLAGPITLLIASEGSFEAGILVKNAGAMDRVTKVNRVVFDKTGTLTLPEMYVLNYSGDTEALMMAAAIESHSNHPVARAIVQYAGNISHKDADQVKEMPGSGIEGMCCGHKISVISGENGDLRITVDGTVRGVLKIGSKIRPEAEETIAEMKEKGMKISVLTGDRSRDSASAVESIGVDEVLTGLSPEDKAAIIRKYQEAGDYVMFVGDGINDVMAIDQADVGVAMGSGSDITRSQGDFVLLRNDLRAILSIFDISSKTISKVKQNIIWAISYNSALIPVAAGVLVPIFGAGIYSFLPMLAAFAMGMSSSTVVLNSIRLRGKIGRNVNYAWT
ncbi:heavy-metal transporting P-type ATPase related protein [Thermoplasma acidophilum]|uniref:Heavy-metal transporting P-type ATPase related protein n=1 Tax=Thermoplasma acidophilum (strain ATCC 25905 / DSM 1728 / JCM 9062 / NBRC 15155 / AMRC-C165) TaxID=273075 RepID=Q9HJ30_THEAC|nr:cation-translocating P-type ATPase [Thermoplasma acidophilum]MCY0851875.1 cation-translocating P-type ATPase [Thermoplasma acidophilum]CAC12269.1 heavy-metal transporting P-type ATPase related protein [Thermoplasma acidophilum]